MLGASFILFKIPKKYPIIRLFRFLTVLMSGDVRNIDLIG